MPHYNFKKDLPIARVSEDEVAKILESKHQFTIHTSNNKNSDYDILATKEGKTYTFEVKEDFTCERTGNVGVEFESWGRPAGISVSKADFYVYKLHTPQEGIVYWIIKTDALKKMIADKMYFRIVNGGDTGSNSMNYLFKLNVFTSKGARLQ